MYSSTSSTQAWSRGGVRVAILVQATLGRGCKTTLKKSLPWLGQCCCGSVCSNAGRRQAGWDGMDGGGSEWVGGHTTSAHGDIFALRPMVLAAKERG